MPSDPFYTSTVWRELRASVLRQRPVCEVAGCGKRASHVDHRQTRRVRPDLALVVSNLSALCHGHHSSKTAQSDGGFGHKRGGVAKLRVVGCDADGNPLDPGHRWRQ